MPQTGVQENVLSAFGSASYKEVCADISAYGKYGSMELTDTAKEIILEKAAEKIGINRQAGTMWKQCSFPKTVKTAVFFADL